jgi:hypothetical protein
MDLAAIGSLLTGVKTASDIAKLIKDSGSTLEQAEIKLKLADLISALADVKVEAAGVQQTLLEAQQRIRELEEQAALKAALVWRQPAYWRKAEDGSSELPYCQPCYDTDGRLSVLNIVAEGFFACRTCDKVFETSERLKHEAQAAAEKRAAAQRQARTNSRTVWNRSL